ncbi:MAG TPA: UDP-N-acetylmuramate--L-alanine ligase [Chloroflexia bacterium]
MQPHKSKIQNLKSKIETWHFIGIGGAGMSALASALLDLGASVSGSDLAASDTTLELEARGAHIFIGHNPSNLNGAEKVVLTGAVPQDNPELVAALELGLPIVKRAELLGQLMDLKRGVAVAGTHGKTTTSAMISWVLAKAGRDPSYMVGSNIHGLGAGGHWGSGPELVAEADEYDRSFLHLRPEVAVVTNLESDHLEYYGTEEAIFEAFRSFALNVKPGGLLILCTDGPNVTRLAHELLTGGVPFRVQHYGTIADALWRPTQIMTNSRGGTDYVAIFDDAEVAQVSLRVPGTHNVLNSLSALAACVELGLKAEEVAGWLGEFEGTGRRFEMRGTSGGVAVIDDYAHHPTEIAATLQAARQRYPGRRIAVLFQPHTYTRTRDFLDDFALALSAADYAVITEIYASRERDTLGMSGKHIVDRMAGTNAQFAPSLDEAVQILLGQLSPGDVLLTMGAGDVWKAGEAVLAALTEDHTKENIPTPSQRHIPQAANQPKHLKESQQREGLRAIFTFKPDIAALFLDATGLKVSHDEPMRRHNSLRTGGPATMFVEVTTTDALVAAVRFARQHAIPYMVLGNGTNVLVGDYGINGLVIHNKTQGISHEIIDEQTSIWQVDSGVLFSRLARITCDAGWTGQEWSNSVPGSVGGGVVSNAGAHGKELKDDLVSIRVLTSGGEIEEWPAEDLQLGYRTSRFKAHGHRSMSSPQEVILSARITLHRDTEHTCEARMREYLAERKATQPAGKSAGSTFKNPPGSWAGYLIEQAGLKGHRYGQAQFSPKHANFMMNLGGATAADIKHLMDMARERVREQLGIELEPEIEFVGDF